MTKDISTLIPDIYKILDEGIPYDDDDLEIYGAEQASVLEVGLGPRRDGPSQLRLSSVGKPCVRQLWYGAHAPLQREPLRPFTRLKFLYGDIIETMLLELVRASGHLVEGEQEPILVNGIKGHRDCVIDGMLVDVKSASSYSFNKFQGGLQSDDDAFGYLTQLAAYLLGSVDDPLVTYKNEAAFLVMDKVTGHLCLDRHTFTEEDFETVAARIQYAKEAIAQTEDTPDRGFEEVPEGKSGNFKLGVNCSYCDFKAVCYPELRTFMYSGGRPVFLTKVEREPNVPEITGEDIQDDDETG